MVSKKGKKPIKKQNQKQKQRQNQKQQVNVNVKIDQSKKGASSRAKTIIQRVGPQIVMTSAGSFPQRTLESNTQYNQLASIMEKIVENERYKASRGNALEAVREQRISKLEANTQGNGLSRVKSNNDREEMSSIDLTEDEEEEEEEEEQDEIDVIVPQDLDPNMSVYDEDTIVSERSNPINKIKEKADKYEKLIEEEEAIKDRYEIIPEEPKTFPYPTNLPDDYRQRYFNIESGRWNLNRNARRQKGGYRMKELSDAHYKKNM